MVCETSHLTDFAGVLVEPPPIPVNDFPSYSDGGYAGRQDMIPLVDSQVPQSAVYLLLLCLLTTCLFGVSLHHCKQRRNFRSATVLTSRLTSWLWQRLRPGRRALRHLLNFIRVCRGLEPLPLEPQIEPLDADALGTLKVHLERGIELPSADSNGLSDPYVVRNLAIELRTFTIF